MSSSLALPVSRVYLDACVLLDTGQAIPLNPSPATDIDIINSLKGKKASLVLQLKTCVCVWCVQLASRDSKINLQEVPVSTDRFQPGTGSKDEGRGKVMAIVLVRISLL